MSSYEALDVLVRRSCGDPAKIVSVREHLARCPGMRSWSVDMVLLLVKTHVPAASVPKIVQLDLLPLRTSYKTLLLLVCPTLVFYPPQSLVCVCVRVCWPV